MTAGSTYTPIATVTATGSSSVATFTAIASTYTDLVLIVNGNTSSSTANIFVTVNNDSGTNYSEQNITTTGANNITAGFGASQAAAYIGTTSGSSNPNNFFFATVNFNLYAGSTNYKDIFTEGGTSGVKTATVCCTWRNTNAINRIDITTESGNWVANSIFALYGIARA